MKRFFVAIGLATLCLTTPLLAATPSGLENYVVADNTNDAHPTKKAILDEWKYTDVVFANRGGDDFATMIVATLRSQSDMIKELIGIADGSASLIFDKTNATVVYQTERTSCDYKYSPETGAITFSGVVNGKSWSLEGVVESEGNTLYIYFDVRNLIAFAKANSPELNSNSQFTALAGMLSSQKGIFIGGKFVK